MSGPRRVLWMNIPTVFNNFPAGSASLQGFVSCLTYKQKRQFRYTLEDSCKKNCASAHWLEANPDRDADGERKIGVRAMAGDTQTSFHDCIHPFAQRLNKLSRYGISLKKAPLKFSLFHIQFYHVPVNAPMALRAFCTSVRATQLPEPLSVASE